MERLILIISLLTVIGSVMVISSTNPIHSVFWLVFLFFITSNLLIIMDFEIVPIVIITVYIGAIAILFLFVIMMLDLLNFEVIDSILYISLVLFFVVLNIWTLVSIFLLRFENIGHEWKIYTWNTNYKPQTFLFGKLLFNHYGYILLLISLILVSAMIGAIVITLEKKRTSQKQTLFKQHQRKTKLW